MPPKGSPQSASRGERRSPRGESKSQATAAARRGRSHSSRAAAAPPATQSEKSSSPVESASKNETSGSKRDRHQLHKAAFRGQIDVVRELVSGDKPLFSPDVRDANEGTPLHHAAYKQHTEIAALLLQFGASVDAEDRDGGTALHNAAFTGAIDCLQLLVKAGANLDHQDVDGATPLHKAAFSGNTACVCALLDAGASIDAPDGEGITAVQKATYNNHFETLRILIKRGATVSAGDDRQSTALHKAAFNGHLESVKVLLSESAADVNARDVEHTTPLHNAVYNGYIEIVEALLEGAKGKIDLECKTAKYHSTPLHFAAFHGYVDILDLLLKAGAEVDPRDAKGMSPFHYAVRRSHEDCAEFLGSCGASITARDTKDRGWADMTQSASMAAVIRGRKSVMLSPSQLRSLEGTVRGKARREVYAGTIRNRKRDPDAKKPTRRDPPSSGTDVAKVEEEEDQQVMFRLDRNGFLVEDDAAVTDAAQTDDVDRALKWNRKFGKWDSACSQIQDNTRKRDMAKVKKLRAKCEKGIPARVRGRAWQLILGATAELNPARRAVSFADLVTAECPIQTEQQIRRDITRTFPKNVLLMNEDGQETLFRTLKGAAVRNPNVGYCQGMGFVSGMLLMYMGEEDAFWCLDQVLTHNEFNLGELWSPGLSGLPKCFFVLEKLLESTMPKLHKHLQAQGVSVDMYATQWFLTTYLYNLSFTVVLRIWDVFVAEGFHTLYMVALGLFRLFSDKLIKMEFEDLFSTLQFNGKDAGLDIDPDALLSTASSYRDKVRKSVPKFEALFLKETDAQ